MGEGVPQVRRGGGVGGLRPGLAVGLFQGLPGPGRLVEPEQDVGQPQGLAGALLGARGERRRAW